MNCVLYQTDAEDKKNCDKVNKCCKKKDKKTSIKLPKILYLLNRSALKLIFLMLTKFRFY